MSASSHAPHTAPGLGSIGPIDHVGIAVKDLDAAVRLYQALGLHLEAIEEVEEQQVKVAVFPTSPAGASAGKGPHEIQGARVELLMPTSEASPVAKFLAKRGEGIHHMAIRVQDLAAKLQELKAQGFELIDQEPRVGAEGALIAFVHPRSTGGVLLELSQRSH